MLLSNSRAGTMRRSKATLRWARMCGRTALVMRMRPKTLTSRTFWAWRQRFPPRRRWHRCRRCCHRVLATAVSAQLREQREWLGAVAPGRAGVEQMVREYLSPGHRDNPEEGCPSAALLDEIVRCGDPTKQAYTDSVLAFIAARLSPHDPQSARTKVLSVYALMVGTLQTLARFVRPAARRRPAGAEHPQRPRGSGGRTAGLTRSADNR